MFNGASVSNLTHRASDNEQSQTSIKILQLAKDCHIPFEGTEPEREEIAELKTELEMWRDELEDLLHGYDWKFPCLLRFLNASEFKLKDWKSRMNGEEFNEEDEVRMIEEDKKLAEQPVSYSKPNNELLARIVRVVDGLHEVYAAVCVKYAKAVASNFTDLKERIERCRGILNFNLE